MKKLISSCMYTKREGGEFIQTLLPGSVFFSIHSPNQDCLGVYLRKFDLTQEVLEKHYLKALSYLSGDMTKSEIKIIGLSKAIEFVGNFFAQKKFSNIKKVEKAGQIEVLFLPEQNKVRVMVEPLEKSGPANVIPLQNKHPFSVTEQKIKLLIIDDSKTIRRILSRIFSSDPIFEICAMAEFPSQVAGLIEKHRPDVITLDIHMPEMDGVELLKTIIAPKYNIPTVMITSISMAEGPMVLDALENGAVDYIQKPDMSEIERVTPLIIEKVKTAAMANIKKRRQDKKICPTKLRSECDLNSLIVVGSSTGGTEAIRQIITRLPNEIPPILIVQHIPAIFSYEFAKRMNDLCKFEVKEAANGDEVRANRVLIAPGGTQMRMVTRGGKAYVEITDDEPVNRFKPSVDYLFFSVAKNIYTHTIAVILTGMGRDGAKGMLELKNAGVKTIAQDEESSVVFGMPKEAIILGAAEFVEPLDDIAEKIVMLTHQRRSRKQKDHAS